jgi:predicted HD superfamily hydrolase involved in NAD metabolism
METDRTDKQEDFYRQWLNDHLDPVRYAHSLGTQRAAAALARRFGEDPGRASLAGLLHDCGKSLDDASLVRAARAYGFDIDEILLRCPALLHAPAGAWIAREQLGVTDAAVLSAICWHTVPRPDMSALDKVVSVADLIEPTRSYPGVDRLRLAAERDLDEAFMLGLERVMIHVLERGYLLHPTTVTVYNSIRWNRMENAQDLARQEREPIA